MDELEIDTERLSRAVRLSDWVKSQDEVRMGVRAILKYYEMESLGQMAHNMPVEFDELYEDMETMMRELPYV